MKKFIVHRKHTNECDGGCDGCGGGVPFVPGVDPVIGMGPFVVNGGPDKWDNILDGGRRKHRVIKKRKK